MLKFAVLTTFILASTWALAACNCHGKGTLEYDGEYICRCKCKTEEITTSNGVAKATYLAPDCRYADSQVSRAAARLSTPLSSFSSSYFATKLISTVGLSESTATVVILRLQAAAAGVEITFELRDDSLDTITSSPAAGVAIRRVIDSLGVDGGMASNMSMTAIALVQIRDSTANADPPIIFSIADIPIPWETFGIVIVVVVVVLSVLFSDIIATDNFITSDEEGQKILDEYLDSASPQRAKYVQQVEAPSEPAPAPPRDDWLAGVEDEETPDPEPKTLQRHGTRKLSDYASKFYANA